jgi:Sigma-70 region 2
VLERFVTEEDEVAFAALVARYGPMVLGVCRRIPRNDKDIEDPFQATFLDLVRRAGAIRDGDLVSHWLDGLPSGSRFGREPARPDGISTRRRASMRPRSSRIERSETIASATVGTCSTKSSTGCRGRSDCPLSSAMWED